MSTPICSVPTTSVELAISCNNLADMDTFSKSDPFAVLYLQDPKTQNWVYQVRCENCYRYICHTISQGPN